jgi:hypothetical protein
MKTLLRVALLGVLAASSVACNKAEEQAKVEEAKREAAEKAAAAQREADETKAKAALEVAETERKAEEARREARASAQKDIADLDRKALSLKEDMNKAKANVKLNAAAASAEFDKRRGLVEADLQKLNTATGAAWDSTKADLDRHIAAAKEGLDSFDRTLSAKK